MLKHTMIIIYCIPDLTGVGDHLDIGLGSCVLGCLLFEQICGSRFNMTIKDVSYIPVLGDVHNNAGVFPDESFTQTDVIQSHCCPLKIYTDNS